MHVLIIIKVNDEFGLMKIEENNNYLSIICILTYFNKDTLEYDIMSKTNNRTNHIYKFKNVKFYCQIEKDGRIKTIY